MGDMPADVDDRSPQSEAFASLLLESGLIGPEELELARAAKRRTGAHIDDILVAQGLVSPTVLREVMARAWDVEPIDLASTRVDARSSAPGPASATSR